ncbi:MAG: glycosyltransferase family 1 protein [Phycisphaera sp.]|nr:MAG: glycosyltransferase family 1 protein [Phycisphaera sp.]
MSVPVWIPRRYESRFSLLGAMADELALGFQAEGFEVIDGVPDGGRVGIYIFFNMPPTIEAIPPAVRRINSRVAGLQILVDHPLALDAGIMDQTSKLTNFRLALPSLDGLHLLRLRWPALRHAHMPHGIAREALIDESQVSKEALGQREHGIVVAGSIHDEQGVRDLKWALPPQTHPWIDEIIELMLTDAYMSFEQALDCVCGSKSVITGNWPMAAGIWRAVMADLNRRRRIALVESLQGLDVAVFGGESWQGICTGTLVHKGPANYSEIPAALQSGRVCLAWGPTQFPQTFSERLLLSMAAGCASVAENRYLVRQHFSSADESTQVVTFDPNQLGGARVAIEDLLNDPDRLHRIASNGRAEVERSHLWQRRVDKLVSLASEALSRTLAPQQAQSA